MSAAGDLGAITQEAGGGGQRDGNGEAVATKRAATTTHGEFVGVVMAAVQSWGWRRWGVTGLLAEVASFLEVGKEERSKFWQKEGGYVTLWQAELANRDVTHWRSGDPGSDPGKIDPGS